MAENQEGEATLPPVDGAEPAYPPYADPSFSMPNEITVSAVLDDGTKSTFNVAIEKLPPDTKKPYYGGYRNKQTGIEYHHGSCQTERVAKVYKDVSNLRNRDTQTYSTITKSTQLVREAGTQMKRKDLHLDESQNYAVEAKPYFSSNQLMELQVRGARGWGGSGMSTNAHAMGKTLLPICRLTTFLSSLSLSRCRRGRRPSSSSATGAGT